LKSLIFYFIQNMNDEVLKKMRLPVDMKRFVENKIPHPLG
jgi:hypothetical protein